MIRKEIPYWLKECPHCDGDGVHNMDMPNERDCTVCKGSGLIEKGYTNPINHAWHILKAPDVDIDPFTMQKPQMKEMLNQIAEEIARRGKYAASPSSPPDRNNPMVQHTRAEMLDAQGKIEGEQARRQSNKATRNKPDMDDYMPMDGEGYEGALADWKQKYPEGE